MAQEEARSLTTCTERDKPVPAVSASDFSDSARWESFPPPGRWVSRRPSSGPARFEWIRGARV
jgi:hypothetical protein